MGRMPRNSAPQARRRYNYILQKKGNICIHGKEEKVGPIKKLPGQETKESPVCKEAVRFATEAEKGTSSPLGETSNAEHVEIMKTLDNAKQAATAVADHYDEAMMGILNDQ